MYVPGRTFSIRKFPSISVIAPTVVPSITTEAPINGSFSLASVTVPQITPVCAQSENDRNIPIRKKMLLFNPLHLHLTFFSILILLFVFQFDAKVAGEYFSDV